MLTILPCFVKLDSLFCFLQSVSMKTRILKHLITLMVSMLLVFVAYFAWVNFAPARKISEKSQVLEQKELEVLEPQSPEVPTPITPNKAEIDKEKAQQEAIEKAKEKVDGPRGGYDDQKDAYRI
jgi:predicted negative regulator of RcsB-dependent stress response